MKTALIGTSGFLMLIVASGGQANAVEPKVADALQSVRLKQSELSGEIGRRVNDLIYKNYMALDLDKGFLNAFRTRPYDGTKSWAYIGVGKVIDAGSMFAVYTGDSKVAERTKQTIDDVIKTRGPDGYLGFMKREPDGKQDYRNWTLHEHEYLILGLTDHYRYCGDKTSLEHARKLADYVLDTFPKNPRPEGVCTAGLPESMLTLYQCTGDKRHLRFAAESGDVMIAGGKMHNWFDTEWDYGFAKGLYTLVESVSLLESFEPSLLLPSHGPVVRNAKAELHGYQQKPRHLARTYVRGYNACTFAGADQDKVSRPSVVPHL